MYDLFEFGLKMEPTEGQGCISTKFRHMNKDTHDGQLDIIRDF